MKITCCRVGTKYKRNFHQEGTFVKEFKSISELANYFFESNYKICFPNLANELTWTQRKIFALKMNSLSRTRRIRR